MRGVVIASVTAFLLGTAIANAQENSVYVNLSALNALDESLVVEDANTPMFPIVKPQPKKKVVPTPKKKATPKIAKAEKPKPAPKVEPKPEVKVEVKTEPVSVPAVPVDNEEDIIVVDVEPVTAQGVATLPQPSLPEKVTAEVESQNVPQASQAAEQPEVAPQVAVPVAVAPTVDTPAAEANVIPVENSKASLQDETQTKAPKLLIEEAPVAEPLKVSAQITFDEEGSNLSDKQKTQIDAVVAGFEDAQNNKIAIYSYNFDNGENSFRKKRLSLNRAVEIRSYLLQKGYKNFSIKVLNIDGKSDKINSVVLEELK